MLKNDFYTVADSQVLENSISCTLHFNAGHEIFKGHFPGQPVVPGVCMIQILKEILENQFNRKLILRQTGQVKFLQLITPEAVPAVIINWLKKEDGYVVNAVFTAETDLFKFNGTFY